MFFSSCSGISHGHVFNAKDMLLDVTVSPRGERSIILLSALVENVALTVGGRIQRYLFSVCQEMSFVNEFVILKIEKNNLD